MTDDNPQGVEAPVKGPSVHADASADDSGVTTPEGGSDSLESHTGPNAKEARYRVRAREAEASAAALTQRLEVLQAREVERIASKHLSAPADLLTLGGVTMADLLDEDGDVDAERVTALAVEVLGARPGLKPVAPARDPSQGLGGEPPKAKPSWASLAID